MQAIARWLRLALEMFGGLLLVLLTALVTIAAAIRFFGAGLAWYDEVAPILLTWVTYFGAALVALQPRPSRLRQYRAAVAGRLAGAGLYRVGKPSPSLSFWRWPGAVSG